MSAARDDRGPAPAVWTPPAPVPSLADAIARLDALATGALDQAARLQAGDLAGIATGPLATAAMVFWLRSARALAEGEAGVLRRDALDWLAACADTPCEAMRFAVSGALGALERRVARARAAAGALA